MSDTDSSSSHAVTPRILRVLTDKPGQVVYRDEIVEVTGLTKEQVSNAIARLKRTGKSDVGEDIKVVITGQAWRYVPNRVVTSAVRAVTNPRNLSENNERVTPLTQSLRNYFEANPHRVIYLSELCDAMSTTDVPMDGRKVYVGINNAKLTKSTFKDRLHTIVSGQAWQYTPDESAASASTHSPEPTVAQSQPEPTTQVHKKSNDNDENLMIFERIAKLEGGDLLVRDENQTLYRLSRMQ